MDVRNMSVCVRCPSIGQMDVVWSYRTYRTYLANSWTYRGHMGRAGGGCLTEIALDRYAQASASALMPLCEVALARQASLRSTRVVKQREATGGQGCARPTERQGQEASRQRRPRLLPNEHASDGTTRRSMLRQHATEATNVFDACVQLNESNPRVPQNENIDDPYKRDLYVRGDWEEQTPFSLQEVE